MEKVNDNALWSVYSDLSSELNDLLEEEKIIDDELEQFCDKIYNDSNSVKLSSSGNSFSASVKNIANFSSCFEALSLDSKKLRVQIEESANLSEKLSSLIRHLDSKNIRVEESIECCQNKIDAVSFDSYIQNAVKNNDLPTAVMYLERLKSVSENMENHSFLKTAEDEIRVLLSQAFRKAIEDQDMKAVLRYCPLLRAVNLEAEARDTFIEFAKNSIFSSISADNCEVLGESDDVDSDFITDAATAYAQTLSNIFNTAVTVAQKFLPVVIVGMESVLGDIHFIRELHEKCGREATIVIHRYMKYRKIKDLMGPEKVTTVIQSTSVSEFQMILDEFSLLIQYCISYSKYLKQLCSGAESKSRPSAALENEKSAKSLTGSLVPAVSLKVETAYAVVFPTPSKFHNMVDNIINKYYLDGETSLLRANIGVIGVRVNNALAASIAPAGGPTSMTSSGATTQVRDNTELCDVYLDALDECFFLIQKCSQRSVATKDIETMKSVIRLSLECLERDLLKWVKDYLSRSKENILKAVQVHISKMVGSSNSKDTSLGMSNFLQSFGTSLAITKSSSDSARSTTNSSKLSMYSTSQDPWELSTDMAVFRVLENFVRYSTRLKADISKMVALVYDINSANEHASNKLLSNSLTPSHKLSLEESALIGIVSGYDNSISIFDKLLRSGIESLCKVLTTEHLKTIIHFAFSSPNAPAGATNFDLSDDDFLQQDSVGLLPKLLVAPIVALVGSCVSGLSDLSRELFLEYFAEGSSGQLEMFMLKCKFRYASSLKFDECVRAIISVMQQYASEDNKAGNGRSSAISTIRAKFSRMRSFMSVLTAESPISVTTLDTDVTDFSHQNLYGISTSEVKAIENLRSDFTRGKRK